ncbi:MAG: hypothetical protein WDN09_03685 [bacterium]
MATYRRRRLAPASAVRPIKERPFLYWFLNIFGASLFWIIIILGWIIFPIKTTTVDPVTHITTGIAINPWLIAFVLWPFLAFKISARTLQPEEIGGAYGLPMFGGAIPLLNNLKGGTLYFAFPGFVRIETDSLSRRRYEIKGISNEEVEKELKKGHRDIEEGNKEDLLKSWASEGKYRFSEITTATPTLAQAHWSTFPYPDDVVTDAQKQAFRENMESDVNSKQVTLTPNMPIIVVIDDYFLYRRNARGNDPHERFIEAGKQLTNAAQSMVNTEFKKYTYAQILHLQTSKWLDQKLENAIEDIARLTDDDDEPVYGLGLKVIDARVKSLGGPPSVHAAVNAVVTEGFTAQKKALEGTGDALKMKEFAEGKLVDLTKVGQGEAAAIKSKGVANAEALKAKLDVAANAGIDAKTIALIDAEIKAYEYGKHTYLTSRMSDGASFTQANEELFKKLSLMVADAITEHTKKEATHA